MKKLPESFCVKANQEHELWNKFIQWLNEKGECFNGLDDWYYGIKYGEPCCEDFWGEVITLEQWHEAVNAKSDFPQPVFVTKSGVEIYDEVEMLVWDNEEEFAVPRRVIAKSMTDRWIFVNEYHNFTQVKNAKPIPEKVEVTLEEIAKWKGVDVKQIKIKQWIF